MVSRTEGASSPYSLGGAAPHRRPGALQVGDAGPDLLDFSLLVQGVAAVTDRPVDCQHH